MEQENKYYIPDVEDLRVGSEVEIYEQLSDKLIRTIKWHKAVLHQSTNKEDVVIDMNRVNKLLKAGKLRVPYLTKEQIEELGWKYKQRSGVGNVYAKETYSITTNVDTYAGHNDTKNKIIIQNNNLVCYVGKCKSINDLKYLMKILKIQ